ncbi:MAG TPA: hypothetical protein VD905_12710 [Flavobacteriales bacterium]|nr:hypothetical protein [Flavobacteriales bacterium]
MKLFLMLLVAGMVIYLISALISYLGYPNAGEIVSIFILIPALAIIFQPFQYVLSMQRSESAKTSYTEEAKTYYNFHHEKILESANYTGHKIIIAATTEKEYLKYMWNTLF